MRIIIFIILSVGISCISGFSHASTPTDFYSCVEKGDIVVRAEGEGQSKMEALKYAWRDAIFQAVGTYENIEDVIVDGEYIEKGAIRSGGRVKKYVILGETKTNNIYKVVIAAIVQKENIVPDAEKKKSVSGNKVDFSQLAALRVTEQQRINELDSFINSFDINFLLDELIVYNFNVVSAKKGFHVFNIDLDTYFNVVIPRVASFLDKVALKKETYPINSIPKEILSMYADNKLKIAQKYASYVSENKKRGISLTNWHSKKRDFEAAYGSKIYEGIMLSYHPAVISLFTDKNVIIYTFDSFTAKKIARKFSDMFTYIVEFYIEFEGIDKNRVILDYQIPFNLFFGGGIGNNFALPGMYGREDMSVGWYVAHNFYLSDEELINIKSVSGGYSYKKVDHYEYSRCKNRIPWMAE